MTKENPDEVYEKMRKNMFPEWRKQLLKIWDDIENKYSSKNR